VLNILIDLIEEEISAINVVVKVTGLKIVINLEVGDLDRERDQEIKEDPVLGLARDLKLDQGLEGDPDLNLETKNLEVDQKKKDLAPEKEIGEQDLALATENQPHEEENLVVVQDQKIKNLPQKVEHTPKKKANPVPTAKEKLTPKKKPNPVPTANQKVTPKKKANHTHAPAPKATAKTNQANPQNLQKTKKPKAKKIKSNK